MRNDKLYCSISDRIITSFNKHDDYTICGGLWNNQIMIARRELRETTMNNQKFKTCLWESLKPIYTDLGFLATPIEVMNSDGRPDDQEYNMY